MKVYVSGKLGRASEVERMAEELEAAGHTVFKWWEQQCLTDRQAGILAAVEAAEVRIADALVVCWDDDLLGGLMELGYAALAGKPVYLINPRRSSLFWKLGNVHEVQSRSDVIEALA